MEVDIVERPGIDGAMSSNFNAITKYFKRSVSRIVENMGRRFVGAPIQIFNAS
jgi:hypothetical protein